MTAEEFRQCVHPRQFPRLAMAVFFALLLNALALALVLVSFGLLLIYALLIVLFFWIALNVMYASFVANAVLVSDRNYPRISAILEQTKQDLGFNKQVHIFVYQQGEFNAYFRRFFARRAIFMNSELLDSGVTDRELKWLIARFIGQVKVRHKLGPLAWVIALAERLIIFNLFLLPYERATAYTGDRLALKTIEGDITSAISAFNKLLVGRELGYSIDPSGIIQQSRLVKGSFFGFLARLPQPLPHTVPRYVDLVGFAAQAFPDQFRQFAAENPSLQPLVNSGGGVNDLARSMPKPKPASVEGYELSGDGGKWGWMVLPYAVYGLFVLALDLLFQNGFYDQETQLRGIFIVIMTLACVYSVRAYASRGPLVLQGSLLFAILLSPLALAVAMFSEIGRSDLTSAILLFSELEIVNFDRYASGLEVILEGAGSRFWLFLGFASLLALLREVCLRGFVLGDMIQKGASLVPVALTSALLDVGLVIVSVVIAVVVASFGMLQYGLDFGRLSFIVTSEATSLLAAAAIGFSLGVLRYVSGRVWPGLVVTLIGITAVYALTAI